MIYIQIIYISKNANLDSSESTNLDEPENRKANTGQAIASVYVIGPQYETAIPVKIIISISVILSTTK